MKKILHTSLLIFSCLVSLVATAAIPQTLHFATDATYPPFESMDSAGHFQGYDIDIANALCQQLDVKCVFSNQPFDSLIPSLALGKFDALIGALGITAERQKQVDFTQPYLAATAIFVATTGHVMDASPQGLQGKIIGVQSGSTYEQYVSDEYKNSKIKTYASIQDALLDLSSGRVDIVLGDTPSMMDWLKKHTQGTTYTTVGKPISNPSYFGEGYAIAVKKGNTELLTALNKALAAIRENGTYQKITHTYFDNAQ